MANWDIDWVPQRISAYESNWNTVVSQFESGKEQRRQKWTRKKMRFELLYEALPEATIDEIRVFFDSKKGAYTSFSFMNFMQRIKGTRLAIVDGGGGADTITDSSSGFVLKGFDDDYLVYINGSGSGNDGFANIDGVAAGTLTLPTGTVTANESSNSDLEVYQAYVVRFDADSFYNNFLYTNVAETRTITLVEVI